MKVLSNEKLSISLSEIHDEITHKGYEIVKCKYDKKTDRYIANAKNEMGIEVRAFGRNEKQALANLLNEVAYEHAKGIQRLARWKQTFESQLQQIAEAYSKAPVYEKKAAAAFLELAAECKSRAEHIRKQVQISVSNNPEPYPSAEKMYDDVRKRRKLEVSLVAADNHPIWTKDQVIDYRICLDILGYTAASSEWDWEGTNQAFAAFAALLPELAQEALFSELVGQTAYATYYRAYGPAKICLLTKFIEKAMKEENPHKGYRGVHPSQMLLPSETPEAKKTAGIAADAEMVPVNWLKQYREYDRSPGNGPEGYAQTKLEYWNKLKNHIQQNGFEDPLTLEYDPDKGTGYLGEGNHRLGIAEELGMTHVPVHVYQSRDRGNGAHPYQKISEPGQYLDERGYFPQSTKPSAIGIPVSKNPYTPASSNWYKDAYPERNNPVTTPILPTGYVPPHLQQPKKPDGSQYRSDDPQVNEIMNLLGRPITGKKIEPDEDGTIPHDINAGWSSTLENIPSVHYPTEFDDFLNLRGAGDVLDGLHTDWADKIQDNSSEAEVRSEWRDYKLNDPEGALHMKHAVANAIKGSLALEDNTLGHGAVQYQTLMNTVSDDPEDLMKVLNSGRSEWNTERFGEHTSEEHRPWANIDPKSGQIPMFVLASHISEKNPEMSPVEAHREAQRIIHQMLSRFHEQSKDEENTDNLPKDEAGWQTEYKAVEKLMKWLDITTGSNGKFDHWQLPGQHVSATDPIKPHNYGDNPEMQENHKVFNLQRYPAVHTKHVQTMAKLIKHLDQICEEALVDIHSHDGKGHHFRAYIMHLVEIDPKTVGLMWLLLSPYTSELSMIDEELSGALGHKDSVPRDYWLKERELIGHRDGMGLSHIPLGQFNVALKGGHVSGGSKQSSKNEHQSLEALRIDNPTPAWKVKLKPENSTPYNFALTPNVVGPIQEHWNNTVATQFAPDEVPTRKALPAFMPIARVSSKMQEYRNLGMSVEDVWNKIDEPLSYTSEYRREHTSPGPDYGGQLHDLGNDWFPQYYDHPEWYADSGFREPYDAESRDAIFKYRGQPDAQVPIYRAGPVAEINQGDWVTLSPSYAQQHALGNVPGEDTPVWTTNVPANSLWNNGDSINEWGYHGPSVQNAQRHSNIKTADKLHDHLMNPQQRPDLQTPEGQQFTSLLDKYHQPTNDKLMPWLAREWKKGRLASTPEEAGFHPDQPIYPAIQDTLFYHNPDDPITGKWSPLSGTDLGHWADFYNSNHPIKRQMGDIMQHDIHDFRTNYVEPWDQELREAQEQDASTHGQVVHTTPDNWSIRRLTQPHELEAEGDNMGHCLGSGGYHHGVAGGGTHIYSLRDPQGKPHATMEIEPRQERIHPHGAVENFLKYHIVGRALPEENKQQLRDFHEGYMQNYNPEEPHLDYGANVPTPENWPGIGMTHQQAMHDFFRSNTTQPAKDIANGKVVQIQGKENKDPIPEYKDRIRNWFESMPYEQRPTAEGILGGEGAWGDAEIEHPDQIQDEHLQPNGVNEYGLPYNIDPNYDELIQGTMYPQGHYQRNRTEPSFDYEGAQKVYELARAQGHIPEFAKAVNRFNDKTADDYKKSYDPWAWDQTAVDPEDYRDEEGNIDEEAMQEEHERQVQRMEDEWRSEQPEYQALDHFNTNLNPHWNPETQQYQNEIYQKPQNQQTQPTQPAPGGAWS